MQVSSGREYRDLRKAFLKLLSEAARFYRDPSLKFMP